MKYVRELPKDIVRILMRNVKCVTKDKAKRIEFLAKVYNELPDDFKFLFIVLSMRSDLQTLVKAWDIVSNKVDVVRKLDVLVNEELDVIEGKIERYEQVLEVVLPLKTREAYYVACRVLRRLYAIVDYYTYLIYKMRELCKKYEVECTKREHKYNTMQVLTLANAYCKKWR